MSRWGFLKVKCALCGKESIQRHIFSWFFSGGLRGLDLRHIGKIPIPLNCLIQRCPYCGYCSTDISKGGRKIKKIVMSSEYQRQLKDERFPGLSNSFLCHSLIQEKMGNYNKAGFAALRAAWVSDDASERCRERALELFKEARRKGQRFANSKLEEDIILIDLLRRTRKFKLAGRILMEQREKVSKVLLKILKTAKKLIKKKDSSPYYIKV